MLETEDSKLEPKGNENRQENVKGARDRKPLSDQRTGMKEGIVYESKIRDYCQKVGCLDLVFHK